MYILGGDTPEAVADALQDVQNLDWRKDALKMCVIVCDAPPHGLAQGRDRFPNGQCIPNNFMTSDFLGHFWYF